MKKSLASTFAINSYSADKESFLSLGITDYLESSPKSNKYICPLCTGKNLSFREDGAYQCFNGCDTKDLTKTFRQILIENGLIQTQNKSSFKSYYNKKISAKKKTPTVDNSLPEGFILGSYPEGFKPIIPTFNPQLSTGNNLPRNVQEKIAKLESKPEIYEITYHYIPAPSVAAVEDCNNNENYKIGKTRYQWDDPNTDKGRSKEFCWWSENSKTGIRYSGLKNRYKHSRKYFPYNLIDCQFYSKKTWLLVVEGEKNVDYLRNIGLLATHTDQLAGSKDGLEMIKNSVAGLIAIPDNDKPGITKVQKLQKAANKVGVPCFIVDFPNTIWKDKSKGYDIADFIEEVRMDSQDLEKLLEVAIEKNQIEDTRKNLSKENEFLDRDNLKKAKQYPDWIEFQISEWIANKYKNRLLYRTDIGEWYQYGSETKGIWSLREGKFILQIVRKELKTLADYWYEVTKHYEQPLDFERKITDRFIKAVTNQVQSSLLVEKMHTERDLIAFSNGVLHRTTKEFTEHSPHNLLTYALPYDYQPLATCEPIINWLLDMNKGDIQVVELLRAFLYGMVTGRNKEYQKFLELVGGGGTGKSTFTELAMALVGKRNCHHTTLKQLSTNRFETASIKDKKLVVIDDSSKYSGEVEEFKNLVSGNTLPYEVKNKQSKGGFTPSAMVIVTGNESISSRDYTSGLQRRRITIPFEKKIGKKRRNLIGFSGNNKPSGEFADYLPGLFNWVFSIGEDRARDVMMNHDCIPSLHLRMRFSLVETNSMASWINECLVVDRNAVTYFGGRAKKDRDYNENNTYLNVRKYIYPNYVQFCEETRVNAVSENRFKRLFLDICNNQLSLNISDGRDRTKGAYYKGIRLRTERDSNEPLPVTEAPCPKPNEEREASSSFTEKPITQSLYGRERCDAQEEKTSVSLYINDAEGKVFSTHNFSSNSDKNDKSLSRLSQPCVERDSAFTHSSPVKDKMLHEQDKPSKVGDCKSENNPSQEQAQKDTQKPVIDVSQDQLPTKLSNIYEFQQESLLNLENPNDESLQKIIYNNVDVQIGKLISTYTVDTVKKAAKEAGIEDKEWVANSLMRIQERNKKYR